MISGFESWHDIGSLFVITFGGLLLIVVVLVPILAKNIDKNFGGGGGTHPIHIVNILFFLAICAYILYLFFKDF